MASIADPSITNASESLRSRQQGLMRVLAGALIAVGLLQWATIVGLIPIGSVPFSEASGSWQWAVINLAAAYLVAAVGLWLLASWGQVIWIYAVGCEVAMSTIFVATFGFRVLPLLVQFVLLGTYFASAMALRRAEATDQLTAHGARLAREPDRPIRPLVARNQRRSVLHNVPNRDVAKARTRPEDAGASAVPVDVRFT